MDSNALMPEAGDEPIEEQLSWIDIWANGLTVPTINNFEMLGRDPRANTTRAFMWVFFSGLLAYVVNTVIQYLFNGTVNTGQLTGNLALKNDPNLAITLLICGAPFAAFSAVLGLIIDTGFVQFLAKLLGGEGSFSKFVYVSAAYLAPMAIITSALSAIPYVMLLNIPLGLYAIYLNLVAVKAINRLSWGRAAFASVVIPGILWIIIIGVLAALIISLGVAAGGAFSNFLQTPTR